MSAFAISIFLLLALLLTCLVLSCAVFVLWKRIRTLEQTLSNMQSGVATKNNLLENAISFTLIALLSTQQGINLLFSLLTRQDQIETVHEPHKEEVKLH
jgi:hypothetical protein